MSFASFPGGIHPLHRIHHGKHLSQTCAIEKIAAPEKVTIPMSQHIGAPCAPIVQVGDHVLIGQKIGEPRGFVGAPVHATVSGKVVAIQTIEITGGNYTPCVVIENDGKEEWTTTLLNEGVSLDDPSQMLAAIKEAGIVGMGGAAFPAHIKFAPPKDQKIDYLLLNGAECEPYLTSDHRMMLEHAKEILEGAHLIMKALSAPQCVIGVENNKMDAVEALNKANTYPDIKIQPLKVKYPQGSEKHLIQACTGRQVPSGGLPAAAGCVVSNVSTAYAVYDALINGRALVERIITVTGHAIKEPKNLLCRVGTPVQNLIDACGGLTDDVAKVVSGGPMMGIALVTTDVPTVKGMSGILCLNKTETLAQEPSACIHCGRCVAGCPMHLMPELLARQSQAGEWDACKANNVLDCIECGSCTYVCPAKRRVTTDIRVAKRKVLAMTRKK